VPAHSCASRTTNGSALSVRGPAPFVYNTVQGQNPAELSTYEDRGQPEMEKRLCLRTPRKRSTTRSLVAMMITEYAKARPRISSAAGSITSPTPPFPDDTKAMEAVAARAVRHVTPWSTPITLAA